MAEEPTPTPEPAEPEGGPPENPEEKTFTQEQLEHELGKRLAREREKYADYDELKEKASQFDELQEAQKSELERERTRAEEAEAAKAAAEEKAQKALTRSAILAAAAGKVVDPEAAVRLIDTDAIEFDDDGLPSNAAELVDKLVEDKPYLAPGEKKPPAGDKPADQGGQGGGALTREDLKTMSPDEIMKAREEGRLDHLLGAAS